MERESKRKAVEAASPEIQGRAHKRQRLPGDGEPVVETPETTTETGLKFVETLKNAKDKTGRKIAGHFLTLPDKSVYPQYYEEILLPIAIDTIEGKLNRREYPTLAALESDVKRMVNNAKTFNDKKSLVYEDAERVRKTASNFMVKHNPAYRNPSYVAVATPIPAHLANGGGTSKESTSSEPGERSRRGVVGPPPSQAPPLRIKKQESVTPEEMEDMDFNGKTFQQAQDMIIGELIKYKELESGLEIFTPFVFLPSRQLTDYYALIKRPVSLKSVQKLVRGIHGRNPPTGITDFKSWNAFEEEVSYIWRNAREYNEDGSDIFNLAGELEEMFKRRLAEAKAKIEEPHQPTLKLKMSAPKPSGIKLRFGASRPSPAPAGSEAPAPGAQKLATTGIIVDSGSLQRQQQDVQAGINGERAPSADTASPAVPPTPRNPFGGGRTGSSGTPIPMIGSLSADTASSVAAPSPPVTTNGVKTESQPGQSPTLNAIRSSTPAKEAQQPSASRQTPQPASVMPPPSVTPRPMSGSPHPQTHPQGPHGTSQQQLHHNQHHAPPYHPQLANFDNMYRESGSEPLLPSITLSTHPGLQLSKPFSMTIPANPAMTQQSVTLTLPSSHHYLQIAPHIPVAHTIRPYRLFVLVNGIKLIETLRPGGSAEREKEKGRPLYEGKMQAGVNRIDVECIAAKAASTSRNSGANRASADEVVFERCTIFVHLMRG